HEALNMAAATLYRERFGDTPGIVYAAGVDHAYNLATAVRAAGIKAEAVSGRTPPVKLAEILAAYERAEIDVLINAMLLAEGWNSPRATVVMHLAPTASWLVPVTPDVLRRRVVIAREWQRIDPKFLDEDEQEFWGEIAGRQLRFDERAAFVEKLTARGASKRAMEKFLSTCAAQNPNRRLRLIALADRVRSE